MSRTELPSMLVIGSESQVCSASSPLSVLRAARRGLGKPELAIPREGGVVLQRAAPPPTSAGLTEGSLSTCRDEVNVLCTKILVSV